MSSPSQAVILTHTALTDQAGINGAVCGYSVEEGKNTVLHREAVAAKAGTVFRRLIRTDDMNVMAAGGLFWHWWDRTTAVHFIGGIG